MASLKTMPPIVLTTARLIEIGKHWKPKDSELPKTQGELVGKLGEISAPPQTRNAAS
jgi:hypothetical protein